ncbi:MAG: hypothetical protein ACYTEQ_15415 [Planctomycetota bacterium]
MVDVENDAVELFDDTAFDVHPGAPLGRHLAGVGDLRDDLGAAAPVAVTFTRINSRRFIKYFIISLRIDKNLSRLDSNSPAVPTLCFISLTNLSPEAGLFWGKFFEPNQGGYKKADE